MNLAQEAYEAYARHTGWKSLATGAALPQWSELPEPIKAAWTASSAWVAGKVSGQHDWQIPAKDEATAKRIDDEAMIGRTENGHRDELEAILCDLLADLGCAKTVEKFKQVSKYFLSRSHTN